LQVVGVIRGEFITFTFVFMIFLGSFMLTFTSIFPEHPDAGPLPQVPGFADGTPSVLYAILMLGFVGEPLKLKLLPELWDPLGTWQKVNLAICGVVYIMYTFLSIILLLNLLIALLAANFTKTQEEATLQGRLAFARIVLRLELVAETFNIDTRATSIDDDGTERHVHNFRSVTESGEMPRDHVDESVYDEMPSEVAADEVTGKVDDKAIGSVKAELETMRKQLISIASSQKQLTGQVEAVLGRVPTIEKVDAVSITGPELKTAAPSSRIWLGPPISLPKPSSRASKRGDEGDMRA
jgi:hypothetical protein